MIGVEGARKIQDRATEIAANLDTHEALAMMWVLTSRGVVQHIAPDPNSKNYTFCRKVEYLRQSVVDTLKSEKQ